MPDFWMDVDAALAEVPVNLLPLIDDSDFVSREVALAYNAAGMDLVWNFVTSAGAATQTAVTPTTGGAYDWAHLGDGIYTIEIPASGGASANNDTEGFGWFSGFITGVLPWRGPVIGFRAAGLNDLLVESAYSATRGLAGTALPAAVADAAGGLPVSDAGGLDLDAILADTNELQVDDYPTSIAAIKAETALIVADTNELQTDDYPTSIAAVKAETALIVADTNELQGDWANTGRLDTIIDSILADTNELQVDDYPTSIAAIKAETALIVADTNELQVDDYPTSIAAIKAETALIVADTNELQADDYPARFTGVEGATFSTGTDSLEAIRDRGDAAWTTGSGTGLTALASGTAQGGSASTIQLASGESFGNDILNGCVVNLTGGTGAGQSRVITDYTGASDTADIAPNWTTNPDATSTYEIVQGSVNVEQVERADATDQIRDAVVDDATRIDASQLNTHSAITDISIRTEMDANSTQLAAIVADTNELQIDDYPTSIAAIKAETALIVADTNELQTDDTPAAIAALNDISVADILGTQLADAAATDGTIPTVQQSLYEIVQMLTEKAVSGTTVTVKKVDGSTTLMTFTLDDASDPTSITRAS